MNCLARSEPHLNSCYAILTNINSIYIALTFLRFQASLVSCHKYWQKKEANGKVQPLYIQTMAQVVWNHQAFLKQFSGSRSSGCRKFSQSTDCRQPPQSAVSLQLRGNQQTVSRQLESTPSPSITRFPLVRFLLTRILAYVRISGGNHQYMVLLTRIMRKAFLYRNQNA